MKEKINLLSKGIFEYECPEVALSADQILIEAESGKPYSGFFEINSTNHIDIRAMIFSTNKLMVCKTERVIGTHNHIQFEFQPGTMEPGEVVDGQFNIISNGGEFSIPYKVRICAPYCQTSIGEIRDLYQFANLAQSNWDEAVRLFRSAHFSRVFLTNKKHVHCYEKLIYGKNLNQALEEFLCSIKRKRKIRIKVSQDDIEYANLHESISEKLVIEKDHWGYQKINVKVIGSFITIYKRAFTTEDFSGSYFELEYIINPAGFRYGNNYGKIIIETLYQTIEIPVTCLKDFKHNDYVQRKSLKQGINEVQTLYLKYQMGRISDEQCKRQIRESIDCCRNNSKEVIYQIHEAHFSIMANEMDNAREILDSLNGRELRHQSVVLYCYFIYVTSLYRQDASYTKFALDKIETYYERKYTNDWLILWMLLRLNDKIQPARRYAMLKAQYYRGGHSPLLYWEAVQTVKQDPSLMREFGKFEIQITAWAVKNDCIERKVAYQFSDLALKGKDFNALALRTLITLCELFTANELLAGVCSLLIKGHITDQRYNIWYDRGIRSGLKLTELYEYYMYSIDEDHIQEFPTGVLIYFTYNNRLSVTKKALLYAYIIEHKDQLGDIYQNYENIMKAFTHEQLKEGFINDKLVVLYKHFIQQDNVNRKTAVLLPNVLFKYEISCKNPAMAGVIVSHKEVDDERYYPLTKGKAYVDIYMDDYEMVFTDHMDNRYIGSVEYSQQKLMDEREFLKICYDLNPDDSKILLNRSERAMKYQKMDDISIDIYKRTLLLMKIKKSYRKNILKNLIDFYYDNYEGDTLEKYLLKLDISLLDSAERGGIIEYFIQRGLYERAYEAVAQYGYESIQDKKLMRLSSRMIRNQLYERNDLLIEMAYYAFSCGKYDDIILEYLIKHYLGSTKNLYEIWQAAKDFEVNAYELEEKILCQILFSEVFINSAIHIFSSYYKMRPDPKIVRAFLAYYAYNYLVKEKKIDAALFSYIEIEYEQMEQAKDVCSLALLKYYSTLETIEEGNREWVKNELMRCLNRGIQLPFFNAFVAKMGLPKELLDRTYVQYCTNPKHGVKIHYMVCQEGSSVDEQQLLVEDMQNVFGGIFVKKFVLFEGEELHYYITEKEESNEIITERQIIRPDLGQIDSGSGYDRINQLICQAEQADDENIRSQIRKIEIDKLLTKELFTIIR